MRVQLTAIEKLNIEHPGLQLDVDTMLQRGALLADVNAKLKEKYGISLSHQTLSKYKQKRWLPSLQRIQDRVERSQAIVRVIKKEGDTHFARAYLFEQLDEAARRGDRLDPAVALREQRMRMELQLRFQELEQVGKRLQFDIEKAAVALDAATREAARGKGMALDEINRIRAQTFGLPPINESSAEKPDAQEVTAVRNAIRAMYGLEPEQKAAENRKEPETPV
jgi:hypothetical protein